MNKRLVYVLLVLLLLVAGGNAYYSYTLNQRIDSLGRNLADFQAGQAGRLGEISDNLAGLAAETGGRLDALASGLAVARNEIDSLSSDLEAAEGGIFAVESAINIVSDHVTILDERLAAAESMISSAVFDAGVAYRKVSPATVRITDGQNVIGSGFIYDAQSHVVTAYHVVEDLTSIVVITGDGRLFDATTVGYSQPSDVAVLRLSGDPSIEPPALGDSSRLQIGQPVIAIGSPLDIRDTVTAGVVSQVNRYTNYGEETNFVPNLLQFDAPVNPGNSGGPLANGAGEVVGIVVARIVAGQGDGIYYAVAANKVKRVAEAVIATGSFPYPWIGVIITDLTPDDARARGLDVINGVRVSGVDSGGPAQAGDIRAGDIILAIEGVPVRDTGELTSYLGENLSPGDVAVIEALRGNDRLELTVEIGSR
jgi:S1-C subfamily serine protease